MSNWRREVAEKNLSDVVGTENFGAVRFIMFKTWTGPLGLSTFLWYSCAGNYWSQGMTLMKDGHSCGTGTITVLDAEIFEILWGFLHPSKTVTVPMSGASAT